MSFDDSYLSSEYDCAYAPNDIEDLEEAEMWDVQDTCPQTITLGTYKMATIIHDHSAWLQARPRTALDIITTMFPDTVHRMSDFEEAAVYVGGYLFDAGYTPQYDNPGNPTWHWLEGASYPYGPALDEETDGIDPQAALAILNYLDSRAIAA